MADDFVPLTTEQIAEAISASTRSTTIADPKDANAALGITVPPATAAEARARLAALTKDRQWGDRFLAGDSRALKEYRALMDKAAEAETTDAANPPDDFIFETTYGNELSPRAVASWVGGMREIGFPDGAIQEVLEGKQFTPEQVEQARHLKSRYMRDPLFTAAYLSGDLQAQREMLTLNAIITSAAHKF